MQITPEQLEKEGYVLHLKLEHDEIVPFIQTYMKKRTYYARFYFLCNVLCFAGSGYLLASGIRQEDYDFLSRFSHFAYGLAFAFLLLPLHEYIHVLAYKSQGAKDTSYGMNLKKFYFMALADRFVANRREFQVVAMLPFTVISTIGLLVLVFSSAHYQLVAIGTLLAHTAMCSGDFGLMSYFEFYKKVDVVTFDDVLNKVSYFYHNTHQKNN